MEIAEMWARGVDVLEEGQVLSWDGRVVPFKNILKRRWGWPKKAAGMAADWIQHEAKERGATPVLWVSNPWRADQQREVIAKVQGILEALFSGMARGASKESLDADAPIVGVEIDFDREITDDGLIRDITGAIANRFGASNDDVRKACTYRTTTPVVKMSVMSSRFEKVEA